MDCRNDLHLTSSGVGHQLRSTHAFPPNDFQRSIQKPLPPILSVDAGVRDFYITTTASCHDCKDASSSLSNEVYTKSPGHWKVNYTEDTIKTIQAKPQRRGLTMGNQTSETKAQFTDRPGVTLDAVTSDQQFFHNTLSFSKQLPSSSQQCALAGIRSFVQDRGVLNFHEGPYLSTTKKDFRTFAKRELTAYPRKEYATYWECEGYPKAWGHGSNQNPLPQDSVPREKGPMRDSIWFKSATVVPRLPKSLRPIPHKGMCSEVHANFKTPAQTNSTITITSPSEGTCQIEAPGSDATFSVPRMYKTEYQFHGSGKTVMV